MKRTTILLTLAVALTSTSSWALSLGTDITISDGKDKGTGWYSDREDQEVEPGMVARQVWDLEAFMLRGSSLSIVGGYDFKDGQGGLMSGDIFLDVDGHYGALAAPDGFTPSQGTVNVQGNFGYEYVLDLHLADLSYSLLALDGSSFVTTAVYPQNESGNPGSNPWRYASGGTFVESGTFLLHEGLGDDSVHGQNFLGGHHYAISGFDLSFLGGRGFTSHFTMECGNDNLMAHSSPVPEPATLLLLGTGLTGLAGIARRRTRRVD